MLTEKQLEEIFDALSKRYSECQASKDKEGVEAFKAFQSAIEEINHPSPPFHEMEMTDNAGVVAQFLEHLNKKKQQNQSLLSFKQFRGELDGFKVTLQNLLMNSSRAIFLSEAKKEASCLGIDEEAISKLITLAAHPNFFGQFKTIVNKLEKAFDKDPQLKIAIESALKACNPEVALGDFKRQENLRALINSTVQNNEPLLYILQNLDIVSTQRFADMNMKDISLSFFKKEVLLEAYRTLLEIQRKSPFDSEGHISKFTQHFLDHLVPATTYAAALTIEDEITRRETILKEQEDIPSALIEKKIANKIYELRRIDITPVDAVNPKHWLCYHLGDAVNSCLHAGGNSEQCIIDGLTKSTSGFYVITEKKGKDNAKEKICAAIYAFMSCKGNLVLDSIEPLNARGKSEYASLVHDLVMEFAASVVQDTLIQRVCLGTGGNTGLCFDRETLAHKALPFRHEQTQKGTSQYRDSNKVIVLAHSPAEEERLQALINALVGTREESETEDAQRLRIIVRELLLTYCADLFYVEETTDIGQYIAHLKSKGLQQSFQKDEISLVQSLLTLESFYKEAFALMLPWVCQDRNIAFVEFFLNKGVHIDTTDSHGKTALCTACRHGQTDTIGLLLATGADVNLADKERKTPLFSAAENGHVEIVTVLLQAGAEIHITNRYGKTLLSWAAQRGHIEIVTALLQAGADVNIADRDGITPLIFAASNGHAVTVKALIEAGTDINLADKEGKTPLFWAAYYGHSEMVRVLAGAGADINLANRYGNTPLSWAAQEGRTEMVRVLAGAGAEVNLANRYGETPLIFAALRGHTETVKALLEAGADVHRQNNDAVTPLYWAAKNGHSEMVRVLADAGADVNLANRYGVIPLSLAAYYGHPETVNALVDAGADVNIAGRDGKTPLVEVACRGHIEIVRALLQAGAELNRLDNYGNTPLSGAAGNGHTEIVNLLKEEISSQKALRASLYDVKANDEEICKRLNRLHTLDLDDEEKGDHRLLFHMAKRGFIQAFDFLIARSMPHPQARPYNLPGDDINRRDEEDHTALYHAVKEGQLEMVKHILDKYQPDLTIKDNNYETLSELAGAVIQLELSRYKVNNSTLLAQALLLLSAGVGKQDKNSSNHPGY